MASSPSEVTPGVIQFTNLQPLQETLHQVIQDTTTDFLTITGIELLGGGQNIDPLASYSHLPPFPFPFISIYTPFHNK